MGERIEYSSPAIGSDGAVYVGSWDNMIYCFKDPVVLYVPYYYTNTSGDETNDTVVRYHNTTSEQINATLTLLKDGATQDIPISIGADVTDALALFEYSPSPSVVPSGALRLTHDGPAGAIVACAVTYRNNIVTQFYPFTAPLLDSSSEPWIAEYYTNDAGDEENDTIVNYANTTSQSVPATLTLFKNGASESHNVSLAANGTNALGCFEFFPSSSVLPVGALRLSYSAPAGSVVAMGSIIRGNETEQFYRFEDPSRQRGTDLSLPLYFTNNTGDEENDTIVYYANTTSQAIPATLTLYSSGATQEINVTLEANGTNALALFEYSPTVTSGAIKLSYTGAPGSFVAAAVIYEGSVPVEFYLFREVD